MSNVAVFTPKHELDNQANVNDFISLGERLQPLNDTYQFSCNYWDGIGNFTVFCVSSKDRSDSNLMHESILPFAKAYITFLGGTKSQISSRMYALRAVNAACVEKYGYVDISKLNATDFDRGASIAQKCLGQGAAYQAGAAMKRFLLFLVENKMITPFVWKSPINKQKEKETGDAADEERQKKMPDDRALLALAKVAAAKTQDMTPRDIFTSSTMTLLFCAPNRGSEPFYLRADCLHEEEMKANRALDLGLPPADIALLIEKETGDKFKVIPERFDDGAIIKLKGIRWFSGKGFGYANKWLPTVMYDSVEVAIERLKEQSLDARQFAKMLEKFHDFPRHRLCPDVDETKLLTTSQAADALGLDTGNYSSSKQMKSSVGNFIKKKGVSTKDYSVNLKILNEVIRAELPEGFPYIPFAKGGGKVKLKWSESLFCNFSNALDRKKGTIFTELFIPQIGVLNNDLAPTKKINRVTGETLKNTQSIFQRWGFDDLSLTSHQLRHMLDTMAAVNGMDGAMRAKWAMRSDPKHNRYYDHTTPEEYGHDFIEDREKSLAVSQHGDIGVIQVQISTPRSIQELNTKASLTAHATDFGMCVTSYLDEPCTKFRDCINCNEHVCKKGDDDMCDRIRERLKTERKLLTKDQKAYENGVPGAEQWYLRRKTSTERYMQLLEMMESNDIEDGALIKLSNIKDVTQLDRALIANNKKVLPEIINFKRIKKVSMEAITSKVKVSAPEQENEKGFFDALDDLDDIDFEETI
jgi:hypothetical protein